MKKLLIIILVLVSCSSLFSQEAPAPSWNGLVRFKPAATVGGLLLGVPEVVVDWVPYISPSLGIPIELDIATASGSIIVGVLSGVEGIIFSSKDKNGMYMAALGGVVLMGGDIIFCGRADIGYQVVTDGGFVFTPAGGFKFNTFTGFSLDLMLDIGFAYRL